jgi:hypothetical protein
MNHSYVSRTFCAIGDIDEVRNNIAERLQENGFTLIFSDALDDHYSNTSILFTSKRPLTCISRLTVEIMNGKREKDKIPVKIGANFSKIRYFNIVLIAVFCFVIPAVLGYIQNGIPDIPPISYAGIPVGFLLHYHVRMRAFRALKRMIENLN